MAKSINSLADDFVGDFAQMTGLADADVIEVYKALSGMIATAFGPLDSGIGPGGHCDFAFEVNNRRYHLVLRPEKREH